MNEEEKQAVEFVKKRTKELKKYAKRENELVYDDIILNLIEKLQKENEELNYKLHSKKIALEIYNRYISKSKIKAKIEELEEEIKPKQDIHQKLCIEVNKIGTETEYDYAMEELSILDDELREMLIKKRVLQELLEESEE